MLLRAVINSSISRSDAQYNVFSLSAHINHNGLFSLRKKLMVRARLSAKTVAYAPVSASENAFVIPSLAILSNRTRLSDCLSSPHLPMVPLCVPTICSHSWGWAFSMVLAPMVLARQWPMIKNELADIAALVCSSRRKSAAGTVIL